TTPSLEGARRCVILVFDKDVDAGPPLQERPGVGRSRRNEGAHDPCGFLQFGKREQWAWSRHRRPPGHAIASGCRLAFKKLTRARRPLAGLKIPPGLHGAAPCVEPLVQRSGDAAERQNRIFMSPGHRLVADMFTSPHAY